MLRGSGLGDAELLLRGLSQHAGCLFSISQQLHHSAPHRIRQRFEGSHHRAA
jgi:hypothetical protein